MVIVPPAGLSFPAARRRSLPDEHRLSFLDERPDAFTRIRGPRNCGERLRFLFELAFERSIGSLVEETLDRAKRLRRTRREFLCHPCRLRLHSAIRNDEVHEPKRQRGL